jgi:hypothetical protein
MIQRSLTLVISIFFFSTAAMAGWTCQAYLDTYTAYSPESFSYEQASKNDWAWISEDEAIEDAFDEIADNSAYSACAFGEIKSAFGELKQTLPSTFFWITDLEYFTEEGFLVTKTWEIGGAQVLVPAEPFTNDDLVLTREFFEVSMKDFSCEVLGDCRKIRFCAYSCTNY